MVPQLVPVGQLVTGRQPHTFYGTAAFDTTGEKGTRRRRRR
jgi:hypothetical protein